jgi:hypothetical protein
VTFCNPGRDRQQSFAGSGFAHQGDQGNGILQQQLKGKPLFAVAGMNAGYPSMGQFAREPPCRSS